MKCKHRVQGTWNDYPCSRTGRYQSAINGNFYCKTHLPEERERRAQETVVKNEAILKEYIKKRRRREIAERLLHAVIKNKDRRYEMYILEIDALNKEIKL